MMSSVNICERAQHLNYMFRWKEEATGLTDFDTCNIFINTFYTSPIEKVQNPYVNRVLKHFVVLSVYAR